MKRLLLLLGVAAIGTGAAFGGYRYAMQRMMTAAAPATAPQPAPAAAQDGRKVLYWYDPMVPQQKFDKPGKSPFMDMQLVPKYAGESADQGTVTISPRVEQSLGVRIAEARHGSIDQRFEGVGSVAYNERGLVQLQARAAGFVEKLHARAPLDPVAQGAPLVELLYPEWVGAQEEYLLLARHESAELKVLARAARQRLALLGMSETEIAVVEREGRARASFTLLAPISGVIAELGVREGMTVMPGMTLFRIVDLSTVWVNAEVPEAQAAWIRPGGTVQARVAGYPETIFKGRVAAILPEVTQATRTLRARIELSNPGTRLKPGMFASLSFPGDRSRETVLVPSEAVIRTGQKSIVIRALGEGKFQSAEVEVGHQAGGQSEIRKGLKSGDRVVLSGQFLIDSEASLSATVARLESIGDATPATEARDGLHKGRGRITALDLANSRVELEHERIPSLRWPAMTMSFPVESKQQLATLKKGDAVTFELRGQPNNGDFVITRIARGAGK